MITGGIVYAPTMHLRFVERDGKRILQQAWNPTEWYRDPKAVQPQPEWRDIPFVETQPGEPT